VAARMRKRQRISKLMLSGRRPGSSAAARVILCLLAQGSLYAPEFTGRYVMGAPNGTVVLTFVEKSDGVYEGRLARSDYGLSLLG
jgi:hypothetical protein